MRMTPVYEPWDVTRGAEIIAEHTRLEGATLVILHALQDAFGYAPEPAIAMIAHALNLSRAEVHGVVTFYPDFRREPAGRHVLKLCRAEACQAAAATRWPRARKRSSALPSAIPRPTSARRWSRSIASACARQRRRRCWTAAWSDGWTKRASTRSWRRRSDEFADFRAPRRRRGRGRCR